MKFKKDVNFRKFFQTMKKCKGDVLFCTLEGDQLNLSSTVSKFIFSTINQHEGMLEGGNVVCRCKEDEETLKEFLEEA